MRVLFLQKRFLFPTDTGGKIRTLNVVRYLAKWHEVTYLCNEREEETPFRQDMLDLGVRLETVPWVETPRYSIPFYRDLAVNLFSRYPYNVNKDFDPGIRAKVEQAIRAGETDLVICDFVQMARNVLGLDLPPSILFEHNVEAQIFKRHAETDRGLARPAYMWLQWKKMAAFEGAAGAEFDRVIAVSESDREMYKTDYGWNHVDVIDTSVDTDFFQESTVSQVPGRMVFVGSMDWLPNIDGMKYFCTEVFPTIRSQLPSASLQIVGRNPTKEIEQLGEIPGVEVTGSVEDTRPYLGAASLVIVPLRIGGGTRLKIPEAMAMRKCIVSTSLGAEGLPVRDGHDIVFANDAEQFARRSVEMLESQEARETIATNGLDLVKRRFSAEAVARQFEAICHKTADASPKRN